jgi:RNA polymerase sigma factor (sigma-70 family)
VSLDVATCYAQHGPMVLRRCRRLLGDEARAVDAMQDTFVRLLTHAGRLDDTGLSSLLYRMATQVCLNRLRTEQRRPEVTGGELLARIADTGDTEQRTLAQAVLGRLFGAEQESTQTIAVLHLLDGLTLDEVAGEVGLSVSGVRKRLRALRSHLQELEGV